MAAELRSATDLSMALFTGDDPAKATRWPHAGWIPGSIADLSILVQSASVPPAVIEQAVNDLIDGVTAAAGLLSEIAMDRPEVGRALHKMEYKLGVWQRVRVLENAFMFQESLSNGPGELGDVKSIEQLRDENGSVTKAAVLTEWRKILKVNYRPIFNIARRLG